MSEKRQTSSIKILSGAIGDYPIQLELVPKRLVVSVYQQDLMGKGSRIPCWIFITQGMSTLKQKEFVLVLRLAQNEDGKTFPKAPLQLFMFLFKAVLQKKRFHIGDVTRLGEKGLMGFWGLGYTHELLNDRQLKLPKHYLTCMLLNKEELMAAQLFGLTRVLARMGYEINRFPVSPWNDRERKGVPMQGVIRNSEFKDIKTLPLKQCSVNLVGGDKVVLLLVPAMHSAIANFVKQQAAASQLAFTTQLLSYHEGALVWLPEKDLIEMNLHPDANGDLIAGSFITFARAEQSGAKMMEDGFHLQLDQEGWQAVQNAILRKQNISIAAANGDMTFSLVWNTTANPEIMSGLNVTGGADEGGEVVGGSGAGWLGKLKSVFKRE